MWRVILPNKKTIKEQEEDLKKQIKEKYTEEDLQFTKEDIVAFIIAAFQVLAPYLIMVVIVFTLFVWFFTEVFLK